MLKYQNIEQAIIDGDIAKIRAMLITFLDLDPSDNYGNIVKALNQIKNGDNDKLKNVFIEDPDSLNYEKINWTKDYYNEVKSELYRKFSKKRIELLIKMGKHLYKDESKIELESPKTDNKKLITIATVICIGLIGGYIIYKLLK